MALSKANKHFASDVHVILPESKRLDLPKSHTETQR